jgi:hypothetical protein
MKFIRTILWIQGMYYFITAIWPLLHIESFMEVTGYKTDVWLVKTVGALLIPVSLCMLIHNFIKTDHRPVALLCVLSAIAFMTIDFYYAITDVIRDVYMLDGVIQIAFLLLWIYAIAAKGESLKNNSRHDLENIESIH